MAKKATRALRVELIRTETQSLVKGTCHKMQNMNYFHRNTQQFKKSDSQGINTCLKNKSQSSVMNYVLLYFICYKGTVLETWALPRSSSPRMTPEANQVTSEHTCLVTTRNRAAKSRTGDLASQYSQLFNGRKPPLKWHFLARIPQQWGFFHLIKSTTFPLDTQSSCDMMCRRYLPLSITKSLEELFIKERYFLPHWTGKVRVKKKHWIHDLLSLKTTWPQSFISLESGRRGATTFNLGACGRQPQCAPQFHFII